MDATDQTPTITFREQATVVNEQLMFYVDSPPENPKLPTLVMLHGFMSDSQSIIPLASQLGYEGRVIIPDLPGFGRSAPIDDLGNASIEKYAAWLGSFLKTVLSKNEQVVILGYSFGAYIVQVYLGEKADAIHVNGCILLCPVTRIQRTANLYTTVFLKLSELSEQMAERAWRSQHDFTTIYLSKNNHVWTKLGLVRYRRREMSFFNPQLVRDLFVDIRELNIENYFSRIRVPMWTVLAEKDNLADNENTQWLIDTYDHTENVYRIEGVGHLAPLEATERIRDTVRQALDEATAISKSAH